MDVAEVANEPETELARWTADEFVELLNEGFIKDRRIELLDGLMVTEMPQGPVHDFVFRALQAAFSAMGAAQEGLLASCTIVLRNGNVVEPEFVMLDKRAIGRFGLARDSDVLWVIKVSVTSRRKDLTDKRDDYAAAGGPEYWAFDGVRRGVWVFREPVAGAYAQEAFFAEGETLAVPVLGSPLDTGGLFPPTNG